MSALAQPAAAARPGWRDAAAFAWRSVAGTPARRWAIALAIGLLISLVMVPHRLQMVEQMGWHPLHDAAEMLRPVLASLIMFVGWILADAGDDRRRSRSARVVCALVGTSAVAAVAGVWLWHLAGGGEIVARYAAAKGKVPPAVPLMLLSEFVNTMLLGGIIYSVAEMVRRRCLTQRDFEEVLRRRGDLEHRLLESRLAAMQAQVEPRFLFDTLVDIEALYARDPHGAAAHLDRLTGYLRAALPRLRESGSTVEAELDLVRAYLEVVTALRGGRPALTLALAEDCRHGRFYPMLLLPLVQRAVHHPAGTAQSIAVDVRREGERIVVALRIAPAGGCAEDPELARVRERLAGLYGDAARLDCTDAGGSTEIALRVPADGAAAAPR